jgi:hypothetical protein
MLPSKAAPMLYPIDMVSLSMVVSVGRVTLIFFRADPILSRYLYVALPGLATGNYSRASIAYIASIISV